MLSFFISTLSGGGAARSLVNVANYLASAGHALEIVTLHGGFDSYALHPSILRRDAGIGRPRPDPSRESLRAVIATVAAMPAAATLAGDTDTLARIRDLLVARPCDVAVGVCDVTAIRLLAASRDLCVRVVASEQTDPRAFDLGGWKIARTMLYPQAAAVVVLAKEFGTKWPNARVIPNPVILPPISTARVRSPRRSIVGLGRLQWEKGFGLLIESFARIACDHPRWDLEIHGEGPERPRLEELVRRHGMTGRIALPGVTLHPYDVLARASLFVLPSFAEGFPNALCEAMACGVAPIAVDCGPGVRAIVRSGVDGLVVPRARQPLTAAMEQLMRDGEQRAAFGRRARDVVHRFSIDRVAAEWAQVVGVHRTPSPVQMRTRPQAALAPREG